jgi:magnesium transporter
MSTDSESMPWDLFEEYAEQDDIVSLCAEAELMGPRETARALSRLRPELQERILTQMPPETSAAFFEDIAQVQAVEFMSQLTAEDAAPILDAMDSDATADILGRLPEQRAEEILAAMEPDEAAEARRLIRYAPHTAGGLMITEFLAYPTTLTAQEVIDDMRRNSEKYSEYSIQYTFVVSPDGRLQGVLPLRDLLLTPAHRKVSDFMIKNPIFIHDDSTLEEMDQFFDQHAFLGVPVCDVDARLLGVVRRGDFEEAMGSRAHSDYLKTQGIVGGDELRSMPVLLRSRRRLSWLSVNILLNIIAASIIAFYQDTLASVIALAVFLPIISDMSGCSGNQAVAVSIRELSLGSVKPFEVFHVWVKEIMVGIINGIALGLLIGLVAVLWKGNPYLGLVVGSALCLNTMVAVSIGGCVPLVLKRMKLDPALASGPILTTVTDMCGFFLVLSLATLLLDKLT